jgi:hypothetical protein
MPRVARLAAVAALAAVAFAGAERAAAQHPAAEPRLRFAGELSASYAGPEDTGFFNDAAYGQSYARNTLRLAALSLTAEAALWPRAALVLEGRCENLDAPRLAALYLRWRPLARWNAGLQLGRVPPVFGSFARRAYATSNPLVGQPLAYQYLTSLRPDAVPGSAEGFRRTRGAGWRPFYAFGSSAQNTGLPLSNGSLWDTGATLRMGEDPLSLALAVTRGSLSLPRVADDNDALQLAGRIAWRPAFALRLGLSAARGRYVDDVLYEETPSLQLPPAGSQTALGVDLEWAGGAWLVRVEALTSSWEVPAPFEAGLGVRASTVFLEARRSLGARFYVAGRVERLAFSRVAGTSGSFDWDAPVSRVEAGLGWKLLRHALVKLAYQYDWRDGGRVQEQGFVVGQALLWF